MDEQKKIEEMARDLFECLEYDEWSAREYGETEVDTGETARNLIAKGYCRKIDVVDEIISLIMEQFGEPKHYGYADVRNDELAQLTIKILKKYKGV